MKNVLIICVFLTAIVHFSSACTCGLEGLTSRIFNGSRAQAHKYPWIANIRTYKPDAEDKYGICGGSLIDEKHVITAAHCVYKSGEPVDHKLLKVFLGEVKAISEKTEPFSVSKNWVHPNYDKQSQENDFAILTLEKSVQFSEKISPVCIPTREDGLTKLTVAGWGMVGFQAPSDDLLEVEVDYIPKDECNNLKLEYILMRFGLRSLAPAQKASFPFPKVVKSHMCAINKETMGDACIGDSGGPLTQKASNGLHYLMGIVSGAWADCGASKLMAGLYTRVVPYLNDIKSNAPNACFMDY